MLDPSRGPFEPFKGHVENWLETLSPVASEVASLSSLKPCSCLGRAPPGRGYGSPSRLCWGYVGPSCILAPCWTMLWAMLDRRAPPRGDFGLCCFQDFTFVPKFCLKKLSPVACESHVWILCPRFACFSGLRVSRESVWGELRPSKGRVAAMLGSCSRHFFIFFPKSVLPQHNDGF